MYRIDRNIVLYIHKKVSAFSCLGCGIARRFVFGTIFGFFLAMASDVRVVLVAVKRLETADHTGKGCTVGVFRVDVVFQDSFALRLKRSADGTRVDVAATVSGHMLSKAFLVLQDSVATSKGAIDIFSRVDLLDVAIEVSLEVKCAFAALVCTLEKLVRKSWAFV